MRRSDDTWTGYRYCDVFGKETDFFLFWEGMIVSGDMSSFSSYWTIGRCVRVLVGVSAG